MPSNSSIPDFIFDAAHVGALKGFARHQEDGKLASYAAQARGIEGHSARDDVQRQLNTSKFTLSRSQWWRFALSSPNRMTAGRNHDVPLVAWHWFHSKFPKEFEAFKASGDAEYHPPNDIAPVLQKWLLPQDGFDLEWLNKLAGRYAAYRPHFLDPDAIMTMEMICGVDGDPTRFTLKISYPRPGRVSDADEKVEGYIIPYEGRVLFQGKIVDTNAPFIFILSGFPKDSSGKAFEHAEGVVLVGASGTLPSAYPMVIWRADLPVTSEVSSRATFRKAVSNYAHIESIFKRGLVTWK